MPWIWCGLCSPPHEYNHANNILTDAMSKIVLSDWTYEYENTQPSYLQTANLTWVGHPKGKGLILWRLCRVPFGVTKRIGSSDCSNTSVAEMHAKLLVSYSHASSYWQSHRALEKADYSYRGFWEYYLCLAQEASHLGNLPKSCHIPHHIFDEDQLNRRYEHGLQSDLQMCTTDLASTSTDWPRALSHGCLLHIMCRCSKAKAENHSQKGIMECFNWTLVEWLFSVQYAQELLLVAHKKQTFLGLWVCQQPDSNRTAGASTASRLRCWQC